VPVDRPTRGAAFVTTRATGTFDIDAWDGEPDGTRRFLPDDDLG
jgi:hypothetical protein